MRLIATLSDQTTAEGLGEVLRRQGVDNLVERDDSGRWSLWIRAEEDVARAQTFFAQFQANPAAALVPPPPESLPRSAASPAPSRPRRAERAERDERLVPVGAALGWATLGVVVLCALVATQVGVTRVNAEVLRRLLISEVPYRWGLPGGDFLPEVRHGEIWRLLTPAFVHFGWAHILFNLWAFWDLGNLIERCQGAVRLLGLVVGLAVISNLGQYLVAGPRFGGLSGVVYGLLGYVWMMGRFRPSAGMVLHPQSLVMMLVWFVICISGALGIPVANTAHGVGLVAGIVWGIAVARLGR